VTLGTYQNFKGKCIPKSIKKLFIHFICKYLDMKFNIFKITMKSNVVATMEAPFYVNPLTWLWRTLEVSHILRAFKILGILEIFQIGKDCNNVSLGVNRR
jgi:hypothetical protein